MFDHGNGSLVVSPPIAGSLGCPPLINDSGQFQHIASCAPASMAAGSVFDIGSDLRGFCHLEVALSLLELIQLLKFDVTRQQVTAEPLAHLLLGRNLLNHCC